MPNAFFETGRAKVLEGVIQLGTHVVKTAAVRSTVGTPTLGKVVTGATNATPIVVTATSHGFANGDIVMIFGVLGNLAANGVFKIANVGANTFELTDPDTDANVGGSGAYTSGGVAINLTSKVDFLVDVDPTAVAATSGAHASKTFNVPRGGVYDAADGNLVAVPAGAAIDTLVTYCDTTLGGIKYLLWLHTNDSQGLPVTPNGNDIPLRWSNGNKRIVFI